MKTRKPKSSQVMQRSPSTPYKIVLLGQTGTGKSSIALKYALNKFREDIPQEATIGCAYFQKTLQRGNKSVTLNIWDTAGHCRFDTLIPMYSQGARAAIVVYDISHLESFHRAQQFLMTMKTDPKWVTLDVIALVGNKSDLFENREVEFELADLYARENELIFLESSVKDDVNINETFEAIVDKLPGDNDDIDKLNHNIHLNRNNRRTTGKKCCCTIV